MELQLKTFYFKKSSKPVENFPKTWKLQPKTFYFKKSNEHAYNFPKTFYFLKDASMPRTFKDMKNTAQDILF